jgi:hypothetical protein
MVDQIYEREGMDIPLEVAMINALGYANGTRVTKEIIEKNPGWTKDSKIAYKIAYPVTFALIIIFSHPVRDLGCDHHSGSC